MKAVKMDMYIDEESILGKLAIVEKKAQELTSAAWDLRRAISCGEETEMTKEKAKTEQSEA